MRLALPTVRSPRPSRGAHGFSLVELVVGVLISTLVLTAAVKALLALVQGDRDTQVELNRKDDVGRALGLMQEEIRNAQRVESTGSLAALSGCTTTPQLILRGITGNEDISYGLLSQATGTAWRGPARLVRCGLPYNDNGQLDTTATRGEQVVVDSLRANGFTPRTLGGAGSISRNVELELISDAAGTPLTNTVQVPINRNQVYGLIASGLTRSTTCPSGTGRVATGCLDATELSIHYWTEPNGSNITGSSTLEDIFYFGGNFSEYSLGETPGTGICSSTKCTVRLGNAGSAITLFNADVLVFRDRQIRL